MTRVPTRWFVDLVYDLLMRNVDPERRGDIDQQLELPFGMHIQNTPEAKRQRAEMTRQMMGGA